MFTLSLQPTAQHKGKTSLRNLTTKQCSVLCMWSTPCLNVSCICLHAVYIIYIYMTYISVSLYPSTCVSNTHPHTYNAHTHTRTHAHTRTHTQTHTHCHAPLSYAMAHGFSQSWPLPEQLIGLSSS